MTPHDNPRLSDLTTRWTLIVRAHAGGADARDAQAELLPRYCAAVYRFLCGVIPDPAAVEELCQEFALRFVRGDFRHARPGNGRFRDYVRVAVVHLAGEYRRRNRGPEVPVVFDSRVAAAAPAADPDAAFREPWRRELLNRTWAALRAECAGDPPTLYDVLRRKADGPGVASAALAEDLSARHGRRISAANVRQMLHRVRERFAVLLRTEVAESVPTTGPAVVDAELAELGLLVYCPARRRRGVTDIRPCKLP